MSRYRYHFIFILVILSIVTLSTIIIRYAEPASDGDIWTQLAYAQYFLHNKTLIPDNTVFSWTPANSPWIYCAWIPQIIYYQLYKLYGMYGLYALRYVLILAFMGLIYLSSFRKNLYLLPITLLICLSGLLMAQAGLRIKADLFTFMLMSVLVWLWLRIKEMPVKDKRLFYIFPLLFLVWVNSHPGFIFGIIFLCLVLAGEIGNWILGSSEKLDPKILKNLFLSIVLSFIALLINPYGWSYPLHLVNKLIFNSTEFYQYYRTLMEYQSIFYPDALALHFIDYLAVSSGILTVLFFIQVKRRRVDWAIVLVNAFFMLLYMKYLRVTYFWSIIFVFSSLYLLKEIFKSGINIKLPLRIILQTIFVSILVFFSSRVLYESCCLKSIGFVEGYEPAITEAEYIRSKFPGLRMGNDFDTGTYLFWAFGPNKKVFIDARFEPYLKWYHEYDQFSVAKDPVQIKLFMEKYPCDLWCISYKFTTLQYFLDSPDWKLVYYGPSACVFLSSRIPYSVGHTVSPSIREVSMFRAIGLAQFAYQVGDIHVAKKLIKSIRPFPISSYQKRIAVKESLGFGDSLFSRQYYTDALEIYESAVKLDPDNEIALKRLSDTQEKIRYFDAKISYLQQQIRLDQGNRVLKEKLIALLAYTGNYQEAIKTQKQLLVKYPREDISIYYNIACMYARMNNPDESVKWLDLALKNGFNDLTLLKKDNDLKSISQTTYYKKLVHE